MGVRILKELCIRVYAYACICVPYMIIHGVLRQAEFVCDVLAVIVVIDVPQYAHLSIRDVTVELRIADHVLALAFASERARNALEPEPALVVQIKRLIYDTEVAFQEAVHDSEALVLFVHQPGVLLIQSLERFGIELRYLIVHNFNNIGTN